MSRKMISQRMARCAIVILMAYYFLPAALYAAVPHLIRYQGTLVDAQQVPLEGPYTLTFRVYEAATGGSAVWQETQTAVPVVHGQFSVLLGQVTPLDLAFDKDLWLSIAVNSNGEMSPRQQLSSVPYAYRAEIATTAQTAQNMKTSAIEDDGSKFVPVGGIILWTGASCPAGYTRVTEFDGKHVVSGATAGINQGNDTQNITLTVANLPAHHHTLGNHTHTIPPHTHGLNMDMGGPGNGGFVVPSSGAGDNYTYQTQPSGGGITGPASGDTGDTGSGAAISFDNRPAGRTILLCQKQ